MTTHAPNRPILPEDSSAFSLDVLRAREAEHEPTAATSASDSGVIDLDALHTSGSLSDDLVTARLVASPQPAPRPTTPRWAVATLGLLGGAVVALATMVAVGMPHGTATRDPAPRPTMAAATLVEPDVPVRNDLDIDAAVIPYAKTTSPTPVVSEPEPEPEPAVTTTRTKAKVKSTRTTKRASTPKAEPAPAPKVAAATPPAPKAESDLSVQCILDPASCGKGSSAKPKAKPAAPTTNLPDKLSASQIRSALTGPKSKAKQCGDMHAAPAGTTVRVKLSIAGSGEVRAATPQAPFANALGRCVADALATADFEPFAAPQMGVVYSVRL